MNGLSLHGRFAGSAIDCRVIANALTELGLIPILLACRRDWCEASLRGSFPEGTRRVFWKVSWVRPLKNEARGWQVSDWSAPSRLGWKSAILDREELLLFHPSRKSPPRVAAATEDGGTGYGTD